MESNANKLGVKTEAKGDLKSLPMPELQAKLGSSPDGLRQAEAQTRLAEGNVTSLAACGQISIPADVSRWSWDMPPYIY